MHLYVAHMWHTATHYNTLQHTATTLQYTFQLVRVSQMSPAVRASFAEKNLPSEGHTFGCLLHNVGDESPCKMSAGGTCKMKAIRLALQNEADMSSNSK